METETNSPSAGAKPRDAKVPNVTATLGPDAQGRLVLEVLIDGDLFCDHYLRGEWKSWGQEVYDAANREA